MLTHEHFMQRCLDLAEKGLGYVAPNPLVGCVIVREGHIISKGYHRQYGGPHAEVEAIRNCPDERLLKESTLYVNLEPCSHHGKTPPCSDLIIAKGIPYVVVGCMDPNPLVKGKGMQKLIANGVDVKLGVLEKESEFLNRRFFGWIKNDRPYIILKWAESADGFIDHIRSTKQHRAIISSPEAHLLVHQWRSEEAAILVGTNTVLQDDPQLTVRLTEGRNPVRMTFDRRKRIPAEARILDGTSPTIIFTEGAHYYNDRAEFIPVDFDDDPIQQVLTLMKNRNLQSLLVEGGAALLNKFIEHDLWDEARVFVSRESLGGGVKAPDFTFSPMKTEAVGPDKLSIYLNDPPGSSLPTPD
ncbi:MAG TPA: bifunctional diaminohydroxyphosphoribosylaminopyrimidine deaminase/5-amino-6-(5-phosphoribosylamino)uracil reductase RibD [Bacteroidia bacterium]|jgi:diaminohydroxyphosphoribosylaminopyrimidine deaminase/5-amino-6-(5-phosphoribosylamino)uracil reductase|nr:bifunctional diaminohydroxyphosphoribosylaminopyrimidine deaminase/5-amino-6-(5-phosphoribosylamino)uracil reductase RibD [Bacteroidia bacterium]